MRLLLELRTTSSMSFARECDRFSAKGFGEDTLEPCATHATGLASCLNELIIFKFNLKINPMRQDQIHTIKSLLSITTPLITLHSIIHNQYPRGAKGPAGIKG